jgi:hypothetical protein
LPHLGTDGRDAAGAPRNISMNAVIHPVVVSATNAGTREEKRLGTRV